MARSSTHAQMNRHVDGCDEDLARKGGILKEEILVGKFSNTWTLMGASWDLLKKDREILVFPLISGICCMAVLASFAVPIVLNAGHSHGSATQPPAVGYGILFLYYFLTYFVITFFNTAIVACAVHRMNGGDPTVSYGMQAAFERFNLIFGWALLQATVGLVLRMIEDRSEMIGKIVAGILGMAWTVTSFLVVPVLVVEKMGPIDAVKVSASLLRKTWGEQLIGNCSFGLVFLVLALPAVVFPILGFASGSGAGAIAGIIAAALYIVGLALVQSALQAIFQAALYLYARDNKAPHGFENAALANAVRMKA
jgi:hypothetical protein